MKLNKWRSFLGICTACSLLLSVPAAASQDKIVPLGESQTSAPSQEAVISQSGPASDDGGVSAPSAPSSPAQGEGKTGPSSSGPSASGSSDSASSVSGPSASGSSAPGPSDNPGNGTAGMSAGVFHESLAASVPKPQIASEGAALLDGGTGTLLFSQNGDKQFYPASITKLMTALLVAENCSLDDKVTFSATATTNLESGAVSINMTAGDVMTVRQCLYALLLKSANEVGNALAEHVAGSNAKFAEMMNAKAASLGCTNTHFTNPHGLNDPNHYTTPNDMALIARAAFQNDVVKTVASTRSYSLPATIKNPSGLTVTMGHKMLNPNDSRYYEGVIGGKTGYTSKAGNTLVTAAERDGVRLIAVVMKSKSTHYTDTKALFDYGYALVKAGALTSGSGSQKAGEKAASGTEGNGTVNGGDSAQGPGTSSSRGWVQAADGWNYIKENGAKASGEWVKEEGIYYWIDDNSYMAKGWRQIGDKWYYLRSNGAMAKNQWQKVEENGQWFYLGNDGAMLVNTTTPDGCRVGSDGAWIQ